MTYIYDRTHASPTPPSPLESKGALSIDSAFCKQMFSKLFQLIRSCFGGTKPVSERRRHPRRERQTPLTLRALDQDLSPKGKPVDGMSRDFSESGIGFSCTCGEKLECAYIEVTITEDKYSAIGRIRHVRETEEPGTYLYGVEFLADNE